MADSGNQMFTRLVSMRDTAGEMHYERIALADKLLKDHAWVSDPSGGGGDEDKAISRLESDCFADLCGMVSLPQLLDIYHHVPNVMDWRRQRFDLKKIWAEWKAKQPTTTKRSNSTPAPSSNGKRTFTPPNALEDLTPAKVRQEYNRVFSAHESDQQKIARLEGRVDELERENATLKQEITRLKGGVRELFKIA